MRKLKMFDLNIAQIVVRFYAMIAIVFTFSVFHQFVLAALFGNILAVSFILGLSFRKEALPKAKSALRLNPATESVDRRAA